MSHIVNINTPVLPSFPHMKEVSSTLENTNAIKPIATPRPANTDFAISQKTTQRITLAAGSVLAFFIVYRVTLQLSFWYFEQIDA